MRFTTCCALAMTLLVATAQAKESLDSQIDQLTAKAVEYLRGAQQENGSFSPPEVPDYTALVTSGLLTSGLSADDPMVVKALAHLESKVQPDGGVYDPESRFRNYETCLAIICFSQVNADGRYDKLLQGAEAFSKKLQWDEGENVDPTGTAYGGAGYGKHERPDLSNTQMFAEALVAMGNGPDDPAMKRMLIFVSRCQNLETEYNTTEFASLNPDGGFYYTIAAGGSSQAGETANGGLRSYGSMTYAGLKSMIYAGVGPDDPRVKGAFAWVSKHYAVDQNPGLGSAGYFYYLHTAAKALAVLGVDKLRGADGVEHDWRREFVEEMAKRQNDDGSWTNTNARWLEADPNLVTGYVLLTLGHCRE